MRAKFRAHRLPLALRMHCAQVKVSAGVPGAGGCRLRLTCMWLARMQAESGRLLRRGQWAQAQAQPAHAALQLATCALSRRRIPRARTSSTYTSTPCCQFPSSSLIYVLTRPSRRCGRIVDRGYKSASWCDRLRCYRMTLLDSAPAHGSLLINRTVVRGI